MILVWHNGRFLEDGAPVFALSDRIRLGDGVYDSLLMAQGRPLHLARHRKRLEEGCAILEIALDLSNWENILLEFAERNGMGKGRYAVNTVISRGPSPRGLKMPLDVQIQMGIRASPVPDAYPPVHAMIAETVRRNEGSPLARVKSLQCADSILALRLAEKKGMNEAILLNNAGAVACASAANIFALVEGRLVTPPLKDGAMAGIVRGLMMEHYAVAERTLWPQDLLRAEALFLTNSIRGVTAITSLNGKSFGEPPLHIDRDFGVS